GVAGLQVGGPRRMGTQPPPPAENGYRLWLRYAPPGEAVARYRQAIRQIIVEGTSGTAQVTRAELASAVAGMLGSAVPATQPQGLQDGALVVGAPTNSAVIRGLGWDADLVKAGPEGFVIRSVRVANHPVIAI